MDLTSLVRSTARAHQGLSAGRLRLARVVAIAIGISLSIATPLDARATDQAIKEIKTIARFTLNDKQYKCHNEIIYRESRWDHKAIGNIKGTKRTYGLYQMKIESIRVASPLRQYWKFWHYTIHRYGSIGEDPNYCKALNHLISKGWQ
jgi:hypothetical protein